MKPMAKFDARDGVLILTPRMVGDAVWRHECGGPVEDNVRKIPDVLAYLHIKYPIVPHWLFVETVTEVITEVVEIDGKLKDKPISDGMAVQLIEKARCIGLFETARPDGAKTNLIYFFTEEQKAKLHRIRRAEALGYALALAQAKDPMNLKIGRAPENEHIYRHAGSLMFRRDEAWEKVMVKLRKILHVVGLSVALAMASGLITATILGVATIEARADFSNVIKNA